MTKHKKFTGPRGSEAGGSNGSLFPFPSKFSVCHRPRSSSRGKPSFAKCFLLVVVVVHVFLLSLPSDRFAAKVLCFN